VPHPQLACPSAARRAASLLTLEDTVEFFNLIAGVKLTQQEKTDVVAFMRQL
jgi:hypothetical protein